MIVIHIPLTITIFLEEFIELYSKMSRNQNLIYKQMKS